jgi:hypothetical protein
MADAEARKRIAREVEEGDWKWLMSSKRGRRIVWRLLEQARVFHATFNTNALVMAFNEGNRNYGTMILTAIHTFCPELYPVMVRENTKEKNGDGDGAKHN